MTDPIVSEWDTKLRAIVRSAYDTCPNCDGVGMQDYGENIGECSQCRGDCVVRARDGRGRFTTVSAFGAIDVEETEPA